MTNVNHVAARPRAGRQRNWLRGICSTAIVLGLAASANTSVGAPADQTASSAPANGPATEPAAPRSEIDPYLPALQAAEARSDWAEVERLAATATRELKARLGERDAAVAEALEWLATGLAEQDRAPEAEANLREALRIRLAVQGEESLDTATAYTNLAMTVRDDGRYAEAEPLFRAALQIRRTVQGEQHPDTAQSYSSLATILHLLGRYDEADPLFRKALEIWRAANGERNADTATGYNDLAANLTRQGRFSDAEPLFRKALEISLATLGELHSDTAASYVNLASVIEDQGRYAESEPLIRKAVEIWRTVLGEQHPYTGFGYTNLAINLREQGRDAEAEPLLRRALEIQRAAHGEQHPETATAYNNLGSNLTTQHRYVEAEAFHRKALEIRRTRLGEQHRDTAGSYSNLATSLSGQGRYAEAEPLLRQALEVWRTSLGEQHPTTAQGYSNLAMNLDRQGRYVEAEPLYRRALEIRRAALGEQHPGTAISYNNLALHLEAQGRYAEAEPLYRMALEIRRATLGEQHPDTAWTYSDFADNLNKSGRHQEGADFSARAIAIVRHNRAAALTARTSDGAGGDPQAAIFRLYPAIAWDAAAERPARTPELRASAFTALQDSIQGSTARALAQAAARSRSASERSAAAGCTVLDLPGLIREQQDLQGRARYEDARLLKALGAADQSDAPKARAELETILARLGVLDADIGRCFPRYAELISAGALNVAEVQARLQRDEAVLLIAPALDDVFVFAVSKTNIAWHRLEGGATPLAERVRRLRCQLDSATCAGAPSGASGFDRGASYELYRDLVQPVEGVLGRTKRLYVVTSGPASSLPLGVLATSAPLAGEDDADSEVLASTEWLSDRYAMTTLPSVSSLRVFGRAQPTPPGPALLGYGDPVLGEPPTTAPDQSAPRSRVRVYRSVDADGVSLADPQTLRQAFSPLPGARVELLNIAQALGAPADSLHLGVDATEASVRASTDLASARVVVFATHGLLPNEISGMDEPGLVFTPPATASAQDDGVLAASEAAGLNLSARWIILSACNIASADGSASGESLSGLAKAFLYAGARSLLVSHWRVRDDASSLLTVETLAVQRANPRMTRAQALQRAMRTVRTGRRADGSPLPGWTPSMAQPSAWGPFVIVSDQDQ